MNSVIPKQNKTKEIKCKSIQICTTTIEMHTLKKKKKLGAGNQGHLRCSVYMLITPLKKEILKCKEKLQKEQTNC
jgi:hypothetical protein